MKPLGEYKRKAFTALCMALVTAGSAAATTVDWGAIRNMVGNATDMIFYFIGIMLDGVGMIVPKMFSPLLLLALLGAFITMIGVVVGIPVAIVVYISHLLKMKERRGV